MKEEVLSMNILLICACGASTAMITEVMKDNCLPEEKDWIIEAKSMVQAKDVIGKYDIILIAPQIRYQKKMIEKIATPMGIPVMDINPTDYGMGYGDKIMNEVRKVLKK